jgi:levanbiose-producing levanase
MNRRDFLLSTTGFAFAASALPGQETISPASGDVVLEDFENGWSGWAFTGNCWGKAPTAASRYRDRITNYHGDFYLLSAPLGTGVATSPEYLLTRPYVKFRIAGGSSRQTRVELWVEGKLDRWVSANDSLDFESVCIDVAHHQGKKLTLKVIDESVDREWGMILMDDLRLSDTPPAVYPFTPEQFGLRQERQTV